ncbi:MAG: GDSL-type esterase/lipase family protein [Ignavibacteriaceae bacterium]|nr:GDSL-type esterase/lipase family protein [Ignavibacteriaceae bacterium]
MNIILAGDSLTEGMNVTAHLPGYRVLNKGVYGDNLEGLISRLHRDVISNNPDLLFILIGTNDFALGRSNAEMMISFKKMIDQLAGSLPDCSIYISSLLPTREIENRPNERIEEINRHLEVLVNEAGFGFLPLHEVFTDESGMLRKEATTDGLHLSKKGYNLWAEVLEKYIRFHQSERKSAVSN